MCCYNGEVIDEVPANLNILKCEPVYEELPGWEEDITGVKSLDGLPENARKYVERVSELTGIQISMFSVDQITKQILFVMYMKLNYF